MGWEAIEQYLTEVEKEVRSVDQRVPRCPSDYTDIMLYTDLRTDSQGTDFLADDEIGYSSPNRPIAVQNSSEQNFSSEESNDICDLDSISQDQSFYHGEQYMQDPLVKHQMNDFSEQNYSYDNTYFDCTPFRPVNIKSEITDQRCNTDCSEDIICEQLDNNLLRSKAISECVMEIESTCRCLCISHDPLDWTPNQVQMWIVWQCRRDNVPPPNMEFFKFSGTELCALSEEYFKTYAPQNASVLFSRLDIWRSVAQQTTQSFAPQLSHIPVPRSPTVSPIPDSVSTSPSPQFRDEESQPSTPSYYKSEDLDRLPAETMHHHRQTIQLWQFLKLLLEDGHYTDCIRWVDHSRGIFKIENSTRVAKLWGKRKNRPAMNYDKLSRSIRQYYKKNIIKKTEHSKRLVYQFCHM